MTDATKLFVGQVPSVCSEEMLRPVFQPYGTILEISVMRDRYGKSKGCAWVTYSSKSQADTAIEHLHDKHCIPPQTNPLQVRLATSPPLRMQNSMIPNLPPAHNDVHPEYNAHAPMYTSNPMQWGSPINPFTGFAVNPPQRPEWMGFMPQGHRAMSDSGNGNAARRSNMCKGGRKLFVGQLPRNYTEADLKKDMEVYGEIEEIVMLRDRAAFVVYVQKESASAANDGLRANSQFNVRPADGEGEEDECKLFVGMIPYDANEETLANLFSPHGELTEVVVLRQNGRSRGAAFIRYQTKEGAQNAIQNLNGHTIPGTTHAIVVQVASSKRGPQMGRGGNSPLAGGRGGGGRGGGRGGSAGRGGTPPSNSLMVNKPPCGPRGANLFIRNLPLSHTESDLERLFHQYGQLLSVTVYRDRATGGSRGFGFVSFENSGDATRAITALNGATIQGHTIQVQIKSTDKEYPN